MSFDFIFLFDLVSRAFIWMLHAGLISTELWAFIFPDVIWYLVNWSVMKFFSSINENLMSKTRKSKSSIFARTILCMTTQIGYYVTSMAAIVKLSEMREHTIGKPCIDKYFQTLATITFYVDIFFSHHLTILSPSSVHHINVLNGNRFWCALSLYTCSYARSVVPMYPSISKQNQYIYFEKLGLYRYA